MSAWRRTHPVPLGAEVALAFLTGAATFALLAVVLAGIESDLVVVLIGVPYVAAIVAVARSLGVAFAVPIAMAGLLAYDWYYLPPTHPLEFPDSANLVDLLVFLAVSVLIGQLAARATRHAESSERALGVIADEQAALRTVATLVARGVPPAEVFAAVARELGQLLGGSATHMGRYEPDGTVTGVGSWSPDGTHLAAGTRAALDGTSVSGLVFRSGRPARVDNYDDASGQVATLVQDLDIRSSVGAPIVVDGHLWGVMIASSSDDRRLPAETESRIAAFTELVATAISNTEARAEMDRLAEEQAALRRVATLVARDVPPSELFGVVAAEVGGLLGGDLAGMIRYETDGTVMAVAAWAAEGEHPEVPGPWPLEGGAATMAKTGRPVREDDWTHVPGSVAVFVREVGVRSSVGSPIVAGGRVWGALIVHSKQIQPLPPDTESRLENFTELVATAISNIQAHEELAASRARIVSATDEERRRVVRDLHDGAQQRLVHTVITLKLARDALQQEDQASPLVTQALDQAERTIVELRELAHGILPSVLSRGGLRAGAEALASRMPVPVEIGVSVGRLPPAVEATAYFVVAEALTNVAKHSRAGHAAVMARVEDSTLRVQVRDDGVGGARPDGSGLVGLRDRLAALDGRLRVESPPDGGTLVAAAIPCSGSPGSGLLPRQEPAQ